MEGKLGGIINKLRGSHSPAYSETSGWERYEGRLPGFKKRMMTAREDLKAGGAIPLGRGEITWVKPATHR